MSESDHTSTLDPQAPTPPPAQQAQSVPPAYDPSYAVPAQPRFLDQVLAMRAVIAVALAALIIGGLSGFLLGEHTNGGDDRFGRGGPGGFRGGQGFPGGPQGMPGQPGQQQGQPQVGQGNTAP